MDAGGGRRPPATLTSWPSLRTDVRNAGGTWIDEPVHVCPELGWSLVTSRKPDDLPAFVKAMVTAFSTGQTKEATVQQ